jgi:two-component system, chemotaxis family, protein-glutamate methylesterase/glutaminase
MAVRDIVVVGFSAGGIDPLLQLVGALPADFPGAVFVVHHFPPQSVSALPAILKRTTSIAAAQAVDGEAIVPGRIYVARPNHHLLLEGLRVRLTHGPREQGHRPAIDPLFRSAARAFGPRVAGVILSGTLDDGTAGLLEVKARGGLALVQEPEEAAYPGMVLSAIRNVLVDHVAPARELGLILDRLAREDAPASGPGAGEPAFEDAGTGVGPDPAVRGTASLQNREELGRPASLACPDCGGMLFESERGGFLHFRCHVGHAYSEDALFASQSEALEQALWTAVRVLEEKAELSRRLSERSGRRGLPAAAARFDMSAREAERGSGLIRRSLLQGPVRETLEAGADDQIEPQVEAEGPAVEAMSPGPDAG